MVSDPDLAITVADSIGAALADALPDAVYHLAAQSNVAESWKAATQTFNVNAVGTVNVLQAARACGSQPRVLLVSSAEVYGAVGVDQLPVAESAPFRPVTPYAASK